MNEDRLVTLAVPLLTILCCLGLPILASVGASAAVLVLGLGLPAALAMFLVVWVAVRRDRRERRARTAARTLAAEPAEPSAARSSVSP